MSDTPTSPEGAPGDDVPWYSKPTTWVGLAVLLGALLAIFLLTNDDDSSDDGAIVVTPSSSTSTSSTSSTSTSAPTSSTSTPASSTTSATEGTDTGDSPDPGAVTIDESAVQAPIAKNTPDADLPFEDGDVVANWYTWDDRFVVAYAGWDATTTDPLCPGNSLETDATFDFISNSPAGDGGCDPEDLFIEVVSGDEGARVCDGLVLYTTIIPTVDDGGEAATGALYGSIERAVDGNIVGATSRAPIDSGALTELDPTADAYTVPDGWLADGKTEVTC